MPLASEYLSLNHGVFKMILQPKHINQIAESWEVKTQDLAFYINKQENKTQFIQKYGYHPEYSDIVHANEVIILVTGSNMEKLYKSTRGGKIAQFELR